MNVDVPLISEYPGRVFQRRVRLLLLLSASGLITYVFLHLTRTPHQAEAQRKWEEQTIVDTSIKPKLMAKYAVLDGKLTRVDTDGTYDPVLNTFPNSDMKTP